MWDCLYLEDHLKSGLIFPFSFVILSYGITFFCILLWKYHLFSSFKAFVFGTPLLHHLIQYSLNSKKTVSIPNDRMYWYFFHKTGEYIDLTLWYSKTGHLMFVFTISMKSSFYESILTFQFGTRNKREGDFVIFGINLPSRCLPSENLGIQR